MTIRKFANVAIINEYPISYIVTEFENKMEIDMLSLKREKESNKRVLIESNGKAILNRNNNNIGLDKILKIDIKRKIVNVIIQRKISICDIY